jgi:NTE family protein
MAAHPSPSIAPPPSRVGVVLAGGSARGAYEVGVVQYIVEDIARALGRDVPIDVLCGTSAGSINCVMLAGHADKPAARGQMLANRWTGLRLSDVVRPQTRELFRLPGRLFGRTGDDGDEVRPGRRGGFFDPSGVEDIVRASVRFEDIAEHLRAGRLAALSISTTHIASGRTVVFVQRREGGIPRWGSDPTMVAQPADIRAEHVLASAAIPLLFPAVEIDGHYYCDGGLRQNVPLSPARRLGANMLLVVNPRFIREDEAPPPSLAQERERKYPDPFFVLGKAMNALLLDRIENDIDRLQRLNTVLDAGERSFGPDFAVKINRELRRSGESALRPLDVVYIRASQDIGVMAAEYARSEEFARRAKGVLGRLIRRIAEGESEADLLSYVLFDGPFAARLIEVGRHDARARHDELVGFFARRLAE